MSDHNEREKAAPYVLDALDDLERTRFERHLVGCAECSAEVSALREGLDSIAESDPSDPPPSVRAAVLEQIETVDQVAAPDHEAPAHKTLRGALTAVAAVSALVIAVGGIVLTSRGDPIDDLRAQPDSQVVAVERTESYVGSGSAEAVVSGDGETVYLQITDLEPTASGSVYEAWLIDDSGPVPAGLFTPDDNGLVVLAIDGSASPGVLIGVTIEPAGGSDAPSGAVLFLGEVG
jgi:anti-sigma-K factor RskA